MASNERNLSSLKQKFINIELPEDSGLDDSYKSVILREINQILKSQTLERAKHYLGILSRNLANPDWNIKQGINMDLWKGYDHIYTDSLWIMGKRVSNDYHKAWYWGNFVPQIPFQLISRYTEEGEWVLDPFCGSGTTLFEARNLGRNSIGIELNPDIYRKVKESLLSERDNSSYVSEVTNGNSLTYDFTELLAKYDIDGFRLSIVHPPYWDIIKFSDNPDDLSNSPDLEDFVLKLKETIKRMLPAMKPESHIGLVIGDMYRGGEVIPLGFKTMAALQDLGLKLRGIVVKDIQNTKAKRTNENLWRYRALKSGFYVFRHEYIFVFRVMK
jgi:hypothetical protein